MRIFIDITECKDYRGKVIAAMPTTGIEVEVDDGYIIPELQSLKVDIQDMLLHRLPNCVQVREQGEGGQRHG